MNNPYLSNIVSKRHTSLLTSTNFLKSSVGNVGIEEVHFYA